MNDERVICNGCDFCMHVDEQVKKTDEYLAAGSIVHESSLLCPMCGSDDLEDITEEWAVDQLRTFAEQFKGWGQSVNVHKRIALAWGRRLAEIADILESRS